MGEAGIALFSYRLDHYVRAINIPWKKLKRARTGDTDRSMPQAQCPRKLKRLDHSPAYSHSWIWQLIMSLI